MKRIDFDQGLNVEKLKESLPILKTLIENTEGMPQNLDHPQTVQEVSAYIQWYANLLEASMELLDTVEALHLSEELRENYDEEQVERFGARDMMAETGHKDGDF